MLSITLQTGKIKNPAIVKLKAYMENIIMNLSGIAKSDNTSYTSHMKCTYSITSTILLSSPSPSLLVVIPSIFDTYS